MEFVEGRRKDQQLLSPGLLFLWICGQFTAILAILRFGWWILIRWFEVTEWVANSIWLMVSKFLTEMEIIIEFLWNPHLPKQSSPIRGTQTISPSNESVCNPGNNPVWSICICEVYSQRWSSDAWDITSYGHINLHVRLCDGSKARSEPGRGFRYVVSASRRLAQHIEHITACI